MPMKRTELIANMTIGGIGAFGQAVLLAHTLESYPFRILSTPPGRFYYSVGWTLAFIAPLLSLGLLYCLRSTARPFVTAIPVAVCPILYWVLFRIVFLFSGYHYADPYKGSDLVANSAIESDFSSFLLWLSVLGSVIGVLCGLLLSLLLKIARTDSDRIA